MAVRDRIASELRTPCAHLVLYLRSAPAVTKVSSNNDKKEKEKKALV
jgi:hypothetical protein